MEEDPDDILGQLTYVVENIKSWKKKRLSQWQEQLSLKSSNCALLLGLVRHSGKDLAGRKLARLDRKLDGGTARAADAYRRVARCPALRVRPLAPKTAIIKILSLARPLSPR